MYAFIITAILASGTLEAREQQSSTVQYIMTLKPSMEPKRALRLAKQVDYWAGRYDMDPHLMVAIIRQESNFEPIRACWPAPWRGRAAITCDHGLAQVNQTWVEKWQLDSEKLVSDEGYNIYIQARILAWIKHYHPNDTAWYSRYHSNTPSKRLAYLEKLESFLSLR